MLKIGDLEQAMLDFAIRVLRGECNPQERAILPEMLSKLLPTFEEARTPAALEKRIAALELALKDGKKSLDEIVDTWQAVILKFAEDYHIDCPALKRINDTLQERE